MADQQPTMTVAQAAVLRAWQERMEDVTTLDLTAVVNVLVKQGMDRDEAVERVLAVVHDVLRNAPTP